MLSTVDRPMRTPKLDRQAIYRSQGGPRPRSGAHSSGGGVGSIATRSLDSMGGGCAVPRPRIYSRSLSTTEGERLWRGSSPNSRGTGAVCAICIIL